MADNMFALNDISVIHLDESEIKSRPDGDGGAGACSGKIVLCLGMLIIFGSLRSVHASVYVTPKPRFVGCQYLGWQHGSRQSPDGTGESSLGGRLTHQSGLGSDVLALTGFS